MATTGQGTTTGCGGRRDPRTGAFWVARVLMLTATGDFTGTREAPQMTGAPTPTMDHRHSLKLKMSMSVTSFLQGRTRLFSTTRFTATVSLFFFPGDSRMKLPTTTMTCMPYIASGSSTDWAHGNGINFTTSMELRDTGLYGFLLPADQIIPTAEETWAFHMTVIRELFAGTTV